MNWPGLAFISAINSFTFFAGSEGWVTSINGTEAVSITGAKSLTGSYGSLLNKLTLIASGPLYGERLAEIERAHPLYAAQLSDRERRAVNHLIERVQVDHGVGAVFGVVA